MTFILSSRATSRRPRFCGEAMLRGPLDGKFRRLGDGLRKAWVASGDGKDQYLMEDIALNAALEEFRKDAGESWRKTAGFC